MGYRPIIGGLASFGDDILLTRKTLQTQKRAFAERG
jgi:hypothetical protein